MTMMTIVTTLPWRRVHEHPYMDSSGGQSEAERSNREGEIGRPSDHHAQWAEGSCRGSGRGMGAEDQAQGKSGRVFCRFLASRFRNRDETSVWPPPQA